MQASRNQSMGPMKGELEPVNKRGILKADRVRQVIHSIVDFHHLPAEPFMSDHYVPAPGPMVVEDTRVGFDSEGNYHAASLRVEHIAFSKAYFESIVDL